MSYLLYGDKRSGSATVELALAEMSQPFELREVSLDDEAQRAADYRAINPQRKLPTLVTPEGETLTESSAILLILAERHPDARLLPPVGEPARAQAVRWLLFIATEIYPLVEIIDYPERFEPGAEAPSDERRARLREHVRGLWKRRWLLVERAIEGDPWFLASGYSLVDIYIAVVSRWAQLDEWRAGSLPGVEAIANAIAERPRSAAVWRRHFG